MPAWRKTLLALLIPSLTLLALSTTSLADKKSAFIEFTAADIEDVELWKDSHFSPTGDIYYNRVDGLLLYLGVQYEAEKLLHPRLRAVWGWPSAIGESYYQLDLEQPLFRQDGFSFGVSLYDRSAWSLEDSETISDLGNNLQSLFLKIDDRDYFREEGVTLFAQHKLTEQLTLRGEYRSAHLDSLSEQQSVWSLFQGDEEWRENPPVFVGALKSATPADPDKRFASFVWSANYDTRDREKMTGEWGRLISEYAGRSAGSDYEYRKHILEGEKLLPITETQSLTLYAQLGLGDGTEFPSHKLFHLGGRGNLRGYDYKEFSGKDIIFGRAEYRVQMTEPLQMIYFIESGQVGYDTKTDYSDGSDGHKNDAGIGFQFGAPWEGWIRVDVARAMESEADIKTYLSLLLVH